MPMNPSSVTTAFSLKQGNTVINGAGSFNGTTFTFNPDVDLQPATTYTGTVTTAAKNTAGTAMTTDYVWLFTTAAPVTAPQVISTDPASNEQNVALNKSVSVVFNMPMNPPLLQMHFL